ncbi:hypothetical protein CNY89_09630, partial [Amaricoccus sp. HAR-UPW-R2A-40]
MTAKKPRPDVLIYEFTCERHVYAGKRVVTAATAHLRPGDAGTGPLPCGYSGSGKVWGNVLRKYGKPALHWR